jgi:hypothetical protein
MYIQDTLTVTQVPLCSTMQDNWCQVITSVIYAVCNICLHSFEPP